MSAQSAEKVIWRLDDLYQGPDDPKIEADKRWCLKEAGRFSNAYKGKVNELTPESLLEAIKYSEALQERTQRLLSYGYLFFATQTQNPEASALWQSFQEFSSLIHRDTLFFELEWTQLDESAAQALMNAPTLKDYRHYLELVRRYKPHLLSEKEERVLAEKEPIGSPAWSILFDKVVSRLRFGERQRTESEVLSDLYHPDRDVRKNAATELTEGLSGVLHILSHIFNTILLDKAITDRIRNYPHWLHARNLSNEADDSMVEALVGAVTSRYDLVQRYYRLKRTLLKYDELFDYDRYAPIPGTPQAVFQWSEAKDIVLSAYNHFSPRMCGIARYFFDQAWIHAPVLPGKRSGAFAHPTVPNHHPYVLLNFTGKHRDIMTLAHELGHGVHQYLARKQGLFNSATPLTTAETASVFGEMLVFRYLLQQTADVQERLALICSKLEDIFATVFRQISMNRFEDAVHTARRQQGELDKDSISEAWMRTQTEMFGNSVTLLDHYKIWWSYIPHFLHSPGYVYAYAFGELLVLALYQQYKERGADFVPLYLNLLEAGGKLSPQDLLRPFGIVLSNPQFWSQGIAVIEDLLREAEEMIEVQS